MKGHLPRLRIHLEVDGRESDKPSKYAHQMGRKVLHLQLTDCQIIWPAAVFFERNHRHYTCTI